MWGKIPKIITISNTFTDGRDYSILGKQLNIGYKSTR